MSQEDFNELLEIFRKLKQWRDEMGDEVFQSLQKSPPIVAAETEVEKLIYFLIHQDRVVYIGQTGNLRGRIADHRRSERKFDRIESLKCRSKDTDYYEALLIRRFKPKYNRHMGNMRKNPPSAEFVNQIIGGISKRISVQIPAV